MAVSVEPIAQHVLANNKNTECCKGASSLCTSVGSYHIADGKKQKTPSLLLLCKCHGDHTIQSRSEVSAWNYHIHTTAYQTINGVFGLG